MARKSFTDVRVRGWEEEMLFGSEGNMIDRLAGWVSRKTRLDPPKRGWRCPDETKMAAYVDTRLTGSAKLGLEKHLADCSYCLNQVATLTRLQVEGVPSEAPSGLIMKGRAIDERPKGERSIPILRWGAVAGAAAAIMIVVATTHRQPVSSPSITPIQPLHPTVAPEVPNTPRPQPVAPRTFRSQSKPVPTLRLVFPQDGSALPRNNVEFRWQRVPGAIYYEVRVVTQEGDLIWEGRVAEAQAKFPSTATLKAGEGFFVRVRAFLPEGKTITSRVVGFSVKGES